MRDEAIAVILLIVLCFVLFYFTLWTVSRRLAEGFKDVERGQSGIKQRLTKSTKREQKILRAVRKRKT